MPETVYISSTYQDLKPFRQAVIQCIVSLVDYYKPVSMEFYDAEDRHFVDKCLSDVAACDIYILILGKRYGYIPKGYDRSITEMEYEKARAVQQGGKPIQILVFRIGDLCNTYNYQETNEVFKEYQESFLAEVSEQLSPKPFDSEAELALQVSYALMKRLFKQIKSGDKIITPDKDAILCFCDRTPQINQFKTGVLIQKKRFFVLQGNRMEDYPLGIVKRFTRYSLGSKHKVEPLLKITDLMMSTDEESNTLGTLYSILEYINISPDEQNTQLNGFVSALGELKTRNILLPFYYDFVFDEDQKKLQQFLILLQSLFVTHQQLNPGYRLFVMMVVYSAEPGVETMQQLLQPLTELQKLTAFSEKLGKVTEHDIIDWLERYITTGEFSPALYKAYLPDGRKSYSMQEVNLILGKVLDDLEEASPKILPYL